MPSIKNINLVKELSEKIKSAKSIVMIDYRGVKGVEDNDLRKKINSEKGLEYVVAKNRLFRIAMDECGIKLDDPIKGPTSFIFGYNDTMDAPNAYKNFSSYSKDMFKVKLGILDNKIVDSKVVVRLSTLPSREIMISMVISQMKKPIQKLQLMIKSILDQKSRETA
jgi:large subunit ribosomal protein L10